MAYRLRELAPGSYDVVLDGIIIAGLVRSVLPDSERWTAELLVTVPVGDMPAPFTAPEHEFATLEDACRWLGTAEPIR